VFDTVSSITFIDANRNRVKTVDNTGTLAGSGLPEVVLGYTYDGVGNVLSVTETIASVAGAATTYQYDALNRMAGITQQGAAGSNPGSVADKRVDLAYNALGQFSSIDRYSDLTGTQLVIGTDYQYDALNRLINMSHDNAGGSAAAFYNFEYDPASRITALTDVDGRTDFNYDDRDQLTGASRDVADTRGDEDYTYDANGNRVESHLHGSGYATGANNRLLSDGTYNYEYDAEGNMIRKTEIVSGEVREFEWDHRNRLTRVTDRASVGGIITNEANYTYDALNRRIAKTVDADGEGAGVASTEHYVYDREHVALEFTDADGPAATEQPVLVLRNLFGPGIDMILVQEVILPNGTPTGTTSGGGGTRWLLADHLGTIRDIVDNAGAVLNHILYDSFGNILSQTDPLIATRYAFTGREFDAETGLHYYRARYYDGAIGRFVSEDPIGFEGRDANLFRYVSNAPSRFSDPFGKYQTRGGPDLPYDGGLDHSGAPSFGGGGTGVSWGPNPFAPGLGAPTDFGDLPLAMDWADSIKKHRELRDLIDYDDQILGMNRYMCRADPVSNISLMPPSSSLIWDQPNDATSYRPYPQPGLKNSFSTSSGGPSDNVNLRRIAE